MENPLELVKTWQVIQTLKDYGCAVIIWTPAELNNAPPLKVEARLIELGWQVIKDLNYE